MNTRVNAYTKLQSILIQLEYEDTELEDAILDYEDEIILAAVQGFQTLDIEEMIVYLFSVNDPYVANDVYFIQVAKDGTEAAALDAMNDRMADVYPDRSMTGEKPYILDGARIKCIIRGHTTREDLI